MGLKEYLESYIANVTAIGHHALLERFVLRNGKQYETTPVVGKQGEVKQCFYNAYHAAKRGRGVYTEGLAYRHGMPLAVHHAWITVDGKAMDLTWRDSERFGTVLECDYIGIEFDFAEVRRMSNETGYWGCMLGHEMYNVELMRKYDADLVASVMRRELPKIE